MKKTFIVFEGLDGTGKTSLAQMVAKIIDSEYTHNDKSKTYEEGKANSYNYISTLRRSNEAVIDRLVHTGEAVYAPVYRGYDGSDYFEDLESKMLEEFNIIIVYVTAKEEIIKSRLEYRGEDYIKTEDLNKLKENYERYLSNTKIPYVTFDNSEVGILDNAMKVIDLLAEKLEELGI